MSDEASATHPKVTNYPVLKGRKLIGAVEEFLSVSDQVKNLELRKDTLRTEIIAAMKGAPVAIAGSRTLNLTTFEATPATSDSVITKQMLGQLLRGSRGRGSYQQLKVQ